MSHLEKLKNTTTLRNFAKLLGFKPRAISYILYKISEEDKYIQFTINKKNGGKRIINAPTEKLKILQRRLADLLNECLEEINSLYNKKTLSHGFRRKHSIITNASNHKNKRYVFNVDLKNFFPSINFGRVRGFFICNKHFELDTKVATIIAQISCHNNELPQGSPCSPVISNLIGHLLDIRMVYLAKKSKCTYSRYADDLTFSTNIKEFPESIAYKKTINVWVVGKQLKKEIEKVGFFINEEKTSMQFRTNRQTTTGLVVNKKINIKKEYYKNIRSMCHALFKNDEYYLYDRSYTGETTEEENGDDNRKRGTLNQLEGRLSFVYKIKRRNDSNEKGNRRYNPKGITKLYRQFLTYKNFFTIEVPLLICEGKTDIIYLKCALKGLKDEFQELIQVDNGKYDIKVKFLNMSHTFKDVFEIPSGTSGLKTLIELYEDNLKIFEGNGKKEPVIVLIDNDGGAHDIKKYIKKKLGIQNLEYDKTYNIVYNLFVIFISETEDTEIEDLFNQNLLETRIDGKKFSRDKEIDQDSEYGKNIFAERVIKVNQKEIDYSKFKPLLKRVNATINEYRRNIA